MNSFKLYWQRPDLTAVDSEWVGPGENPDDICQDQAVSAELQTESIKGGAIWYDVFDVQGV